MECHEPEVSDQFDREVLIGAILTEVCMEALDGLGSWERIARKQAKCKWKDGIKPDMEECLQALQLFHSARCLNILEVQSESKVRKRRRVSVGAHVNRKTCYETPPSMSAMVELVERFTSTTKIFPNYQIKAARSWPQEDFLMQ